jgi:hypothetical protein
MKNPQSNAVVEHNHQVIDSVIKIQRLEDQALVYVDPFGESLASIALAIHSSYHRTLEDHLVFSNITYVVKEKQ